jgi:hypothetical protein
MAGKWESCFSSCLPKWMQYIHWVQSKQRGPLNRHALGKAGGRFAFHYNVKKLFMGTKCQNEFKTKAAAGIKFGKCHCRISSVFDSVILISTIYRTQRHTANACPFPSAICQIAQCLDKCLQFKINNLGALILKIIH